MLVMKFGGTSVQDAAALEHVCAIVSSRLAEKPLVVLSACAGVTNALLRCAALGAADAAGALAELHELRLRHDGIARQLLSARREEALNSLHRDFDELARLIESLSVLGHVTPRTLDQCAAYGESWSSRLLAGALAERGIRCAYKDARTVVVTDAEFTRAGPLFEEIEGRARREFLPLLESGAVVVTQGFIGSTREGITTTLGRGGSDFSAAVLGAALGAGEIQIWTDVDGILTCDPSLVPSASLVREVTFNEAAELAYFGAKVLHPSTILPAVRKNIPVRVLNARRPGSPGTLIAQNTLPAAAGVVKSIAFKKGITVITVHSTRMLMSHGFLARVFDVFARFQKSVDVVATSEVGLSLTVDDASSLERITEELGRFAEVEVHGGRAVVCVVGEGMKRTKGIAAKIFGALSDASVNVELISHGGSEINLTFVIREEEVGRAVRGLHDSLF